MKNIFMMLVFAIMTFCSTQNIFAQSQAGAQVALQRAEEAKVPAQGYMGCTEPLWEFFNVTQDPPLKPLVAQSYPNAVYDWTLYETQTYNAQVTEVWNHLGPANTAWDTGSNLYIQGLERLVEAYQAYSLGNYYSCSYTAGVARSKFINCLPYLITAYEEYTEAQVEYYELVDIFNWASNN